MMLIFLVFHLGISSAELGAEKYFNCFRELRGQKTKTDFVLISKDGKKFYCHSIILMASGGGWEKINYDKIMYKKLYYSSHVVKIILQFIYDPGKKCFDNTSVEKDHYWQILDYCQRFFQANLYSALLHSSMDTRFEGLTNAAEKLAMPKFCCIAESLIKNLNQIIYYLGPVYAIIDKLIDQNSCIIWSLNKYAGTKFFKICSKNCDPAYWPEEGFWNVVHNLAVHVDMSTWTENEYVKLLENNKFFEIFLLRVLVNFHAALVQRLQPAHAEQVTSIFVAYYYINISLLLNAIRSTIYAVEFRGEEKARNVALQNILQKKRGSFPRLLRSPKGRVCASHRLTCSHGLDYKAKTSVKSRVNMGELEKAEKQLRIFMNDKIWPKIDEERRLKIWKIGLQELLGKSVDKVSEIMEKINTYTQIKERQKLIIIARLYCLQLLVHPKFQKKYFISTYNIINKKLKRQENLDFSKEEIFDKFIFDESKNNEYFKALKEVLEFSGIEYY